MTGPRRKRARLWAAVYVRLFDTPATDETDENHEELGGQE
ncbi:hypothetical protein SAMN05421752_11081 [Natronorubrum thiooxidans]|uniref:Uncharacterized protein n=1 Tax=Natronorubrum thiooxidans TaxID=308853 RepID=A0A1N7G873_9EURY|nr:hypothetical protein SAMN05421752_11081 [Natronorubrum thiooxidans]